MTIALDTLFTGQLIRLSAYGTAVKEAQARWSEDAEYQRLLASDVAAPRPPTFFDEEDEDENYAFAIRTLDDDKLIGECNLWPMWNHQNAWLAIGIGEPDYRGKGYGTDAMRVLIGYGLIGVVLAVMFTRLSAAVELPPSATGQAPIRTRFGLHRSQGIVLRLSLLFVIDAFAGGLVVQALVAEWFNRRYGFNLAQIGGIFFGTNLLAGLSALAAARIAGRIGLINTMVLTHVPSNILLLMVPLMPTPTLAILWDCSARRSCLRAA